MTAKSLRNLHNDASFFDTHRNKALLEDGRREKCEKFNQNILPKGSLMNDITEPPKIGFSVIFYSLLLTKKFSFYNFNTHETLENLRFSMKSQNKKKSVRNFNLKT